MSDAEIIDILNDDGEVIGTITREEAERDNHITENALIFIFTSEGKVWAQFRAKTKKHYPSMWDISACGGIASGEDVEAAAERETKEETGIDLQLHHVDTFLNIFPGDNGEERKRMSHLYIGVSDETPVVNDEVEEFKAWDPAELLHEIKDNPRLYVPSFDTELSMALEGYAKIFQIS